VHAVDYGAELQAIGVEVVGVWDVDRVRAEELATLLGIDVLPALGAILDDPSVDGLVVTEAPSRKVSIIRAALRAGRHVITEKLLAVSEADARELIALAQESGLALMTALPFLSRGPVRTIERFIADGRLGRVTHARVRLAVDGRTAGWLPARFDDPAEALVGVMGDLGCHPLSLVARLLGGDATVRSATYASASGAALDDNAVVIIESPGGAIGSAEASHVAPPGLPEFVIEVSGTEGALSHGIIDEAHVQAKGPAGSWFPLEAEPASTTPIRQWINAIAANETLEENGRESLRLTALVAQATAAAGMRQADAPRP
jgi:predicted dehydrogenase